MCISVLVTLCTVFSLMMYFRKESKKVPYVLGRIARCLNCDCTNNSQDNRSRSNHQSYEINKSKPKRSNNGDSRADEIVAGLDQNFQTDSNETFEFEIKENEITWKDVSFAFDRVCFVLFLLGLLASALVFGIKASRTKEPIFDEF